MKQMIVRLSLSKSVPHSKLFYLGSADIDGVYKYLRSSVLALNEPYFAAYGFKSIDLKDPDGYTIVFSPVSGR